jgi:hypothetical protein
LGLTFASFCSFYINLPCGGAVILLIFFFFTTPASAKPTHATIREKILQMDPIGTVTVCAAGVCWLLSLQWGGVAKPWGSSDVIGTLIGFVLLAIAFVVNEWYQGERALLLPSILKNGTRANAFAYNFLYVPYNPQSIQAPDVNFVPRLAGTFYTLLYYIPIYFQAVRGTDATESGVRIIPFLLGHSKLLSLSCPVSRISLPAFQDRVVNGQCSVRHHSIRRSHYHLRLFRSFPASRRLNHHCCNRSNLHLDHKYSCEQMDWLPSPRRNWKRARIPSSYDRHSRGIR